MAVYPITACFAGITCRFIRQLMPAPIKISLIIKAVSNGIFVAIIKVYVGSDTKKYKHRRPGYA